MVVTAPPRPPRLREFDKSEQLEALIEEARRRARRRRLRYAASVVLAAGAGTIAVLGLGRGGGEGTAAPEAAPGSASEIKLVGASLAYVPPGGDALYVTRPDGSGSRIVARCEAPGTPCVIRNPAWSPDGRRIAFLRGHLPRLSSGHALHGSYRPGDLALYVVGLNGRGERRLAACGGVDGACGMRWQSRLSWSPDGSQIALSRGGTLSIIDVKSAHARRLTTCGRGCFDIDPAWSPDQSEIAFTRVMEKEWAGEVERVSVRGPHLTSLAIYGRNPAWAPDGRAIHVATLEGIVRVGADGSQTLLTAPRQRGDDPLQWASWSPDGRRLLYLSMQHRFSRRDGTYVYRARVWTINPNGAGKKRLYDGPCCVATPPVWSGDGTRVAFSILDPSHKGNPAGTFVIGADGAQLRSLMRVTAEQLAWQPIQQRTPGPHG